MEIIVIILIIIAAYIIITYNSFTRTSKEVERELSGIQVALEMRYEVLVNAQNSVKSIIGHEENLITNTTAMRMGMSVKEMESAGASMDRAYKNLLALSEQYPQLRSNENVLSLQNQLYQLENELQAARRSYNSSATEFNTKMETIPSVFVARMMNLKSFDLFSASAEKQENVRISF